MPSPTSLLTYDDLRRHAVSLAAERSLDASEEFVKAAGRFARAMIAAGAAYEFAEGARAAAEEMEEEQTRVQSLGARLYINLPAPEGTEWTPKRLTFSSITRDDGPGFYDLTLTAGRAKCRQFGHYVLLLCTFADPLGEDWPEARAVLTDLFAADIPGFLRPAVWAADDLYWEWRRRGDEAASALAAVAPLVAEAAPAPATGDGEDAADVAPNWYHEPEDEPVGYYTRDSLWGTQRDLSMAFLSKSRAGPDPRRLKKSATSRRVFVRKHAGHEWEVFFKTERVYAAAAARLAAYQKDKSSTS